MTDTFLLLTSTTSNDRQRIRQIKYHINQLLSELRIIESNNNIQPLNISINSQLTNLTHDERICPYISCKAKPAILHSTANNEYRKKSKKNVFAASACATSTPKSSPLHSKILLKPHQTSTPRRSQRHSTGLTQQTQTNNIISLKRLLYNKDQNKNKRRHSAAPFSKRSIIPRLQTIDENPQWI